MCSKKQIPFDVNKCFGRAEEARGHTMLENTEEAETGHWASLEKVWVAVIIQQAQGMSREEWDMGKLRCPQSALPGEHLSQHGWASHRASCETSYNRWDRLCQRALTPPERPEMCLRKWVGWSCECTWVTW